MSLKVDFGEPAGMLRASMAPFAQTDLAPRAAPAPASAHPTARRAISASTRSPEWQEGAAMVLDAIQVLGGNGDLGELPIGRSLRDARFCEIGAGTSEIRRMLIGCESVEAAA